PHLLGPISRAGLKKGILDVWVILSRPGPEGKEIPGLVVDVKTPKGTATKEQKEWAAHLREEGWEVDFCKGAWASWQRIAGYIGISGADLDAGELRRREEAMLRLMGE